MKVNKAVNETKVKALEQELALQAAKKEADLIKRKAELELEEDKLTDYNMQ